jgi:hypothetical protein
MLETADYCVVTPHGEIVSSRDAKHSSRDILSQPELNVFNCDVCGACCSECRYLKGSAGKDPTCSIEDKKPALCKSEEWRAGGANCVKSRKAVFGLESEKEKPKEVSLPAGSIY